MKTKTQQDSVKRLFRSTFILTVGDGIGQAFLFISTIIVARYLSPSEFGDFGIVRSTLMLFITLAALRLEMTGTKFVAEFFEKDRGKCQRLITLIICISIFTAIATAALLAFLSGWLSSNLFQKESLTVLFQIGALVILFSTCRAMLNGVLNGFQLFKAIAWSSTISSAFGCLAIVLLTIKFGIMGTLWGYVVHRGLYMILNLFFVIRVFKLENLHFSISGWREEVAMLAHFVIPGYIVALSVLPLKWLSEAILVRQPEGSYEMGLITAAITFQTIAFFPVNKFHAPFLTLLSSKKGDNLNYKKAQLLNMNISFWVGLPVFLFGIFCPELIGLIFGGEYTSEKFYVIIILTSFYSALSLFGKGLERILTVENKMWSQVLCYLIYSLVLLLSAYFLIPFWGSIGLTVANVIATLLLLTGLTSTAYVSKLIDLKILFFNKNIFQAILLVVGSLLSIVCIDELYVRVILLGSSLLIIVVVHKESAEMIWHKIFKNKSTEL